MGMSLTMTGNPIADGIATFVFWYVLAPLTVYWGFYYGTELLFAVLGVEQIADWLGGRFGLWAGAAFILLCGGVVVGVLVSYLLIPAWRGNAVLERLLARYRYTSL